MNNPVLTINKGITNNLQFDISISSDIDMPISGARLIFGSGDYSTMYFGDYKDGTAHFEFFAGDGIDDVKNFELEVLARDRYFVPLKGSVEIDKPISASIKDSKSGGKKEVVMSASIRGNSVRGGGGFEEEPTEIKLTRRKGAEEKWGSFIDKRALQSFERPNSLRKTSGTWALPYKEVQAQELLTHLDSLEDNEDYSTGSFKSKIHGLFGDDVLFDELDSSERMAGKDIKNIMIKHLADILENPDRVFKGEFDNKSLRLLQSYIS